MHDQSLVYRMPEYVKYTCKPILDELFLSACTHYAPYALRAICTPCEPIFYFRYPVVKKVRNPGCINAFLH